jgi:hypothetical protein
LWSAKEAIFKWWGKGSVDFKEMISIATFKLQQVGNIHAVFKGTSPEIPLLLEYIFYDDVCIVWLLEKV